jgi:hypothetical protein
MEREDPWYETTNPGHSIGVLTNGSAIKPTCVCVCVCVWNGDAYTVFCNLQPNDDHILITWSDGHVSRFNDDWLRQRVFTSGACRRSPDYEHKLWGSELAGHLPTLTFDAVI